MAIRIECTDLFDTSADALILTVDGMKRGMEGNLARQFGRQYPDDWLDMQRDIAYPIPLGRTIAVDWDGDCPWRTFLIASTLHHIDVLTGQQKASVVRTACSEALSLASRRGCRSVASAVMRGGWRLELEEGLNAMVAAFQTSGHGVQHLDLLICVPDAEQAERLSAITKARQQI